MKTFVKVTIVALVLCLAAFAQLPTTCTQRVGSAPTPVSVVQGGATYYGICINGAVFPDMSGFGPVRGTDITKSLVDPTVLGGETLTNGALASGTSWTASGDFALAANAATYTSSTLVGTISQANATLATPSIGSRWYRFVYTSSAYTGDAACNLTTAFAAVTRSLTLTAGTYTIFFRSATTPGAFTLSCTSTTGHVTLGTFSLMQVVGGELEVGGTVYANSANVFQSSTSAAPGTVRAIRGEMVVGSTTMTSGNLVGVRGAVTVPVNETITAAYLYGTQGKVVFTGTSNTQSGGGIITGVYGSLDLTGGTVTNTGLTSPIAAVFDGTGIGAAVANIHGIVIANSTSTIAGSAIHVSTTSSGFTYFLTIDDTSGTLATVTGTPGTCTNSGYMPVKVNSTVLKIPFCT